MFKLYYSAHTRASRPRWLLEELGAPYDLVNVSLKQGDHKKPDYLKLNPNGTLPTLQDGETPLWESAGICMYLADKFPEKGLAPASGSLDRGKYYQWILYAMTEMEPYVLETYLHTIGYPAEKRSPEVAAESRRLFEPCAAIVEKELGSKEFIIGNGSENRFSAADVVLGSVLNFAVAAKLIDDRHPAILKYLKALKARPAFIRAQ